MGMKIRGEMFNRWFRDEWGIVVRANWGRNHPRNCWSYEEFIDEQSDSFGGGSVGMGV
jgi:hypothetical protein